MLTEQQFNEAAILLGCEIAAVKAVNEVEARGNGFRPDGKAKILFEGHIFWKQLLSIGMKPTELRLGNEDVLYPVWNKIAVRPFYNMDQYIRLEKAKRINPDAANKSASWGAFQIMGFNYRTCGYNSVGEFVVAQADEQNQLLCFCKYLKTSHLDVNLRNLDWAGFARGYNGPDYTQNQYDVKLRNAYNNFKN
ncbi:MAG TPA: N-acetylmuramidase family protein [Ferruginibacter sp.]|nr:N-acetylmuramidase family protein [Ferruginibacter sp.]